jgi:hypothetical protein
MTTIGGVIDCANAVLASKLAARPIKIERCIVTHKFLSQCSTKGNKHRLVNRQGGGTTLTRPASCFVAVTFILRKTRHVVVNAAFRNTIIFANVTTRRNPALMRIPIKSAGSKLWGAWRAA